MVHEIVSASDSDQPSFSSSDSNQLPNPKLDIESPDDAPSGRTTWPRKEAKKLIDATSDYIDDCVVQGHGIKIEDVRLILTRAGLAFMKNPLFGPKRTIDRVRMEYRLRKAKFIKKANE